MNMSIQQQHIDKKVKFRLLFFAMPYIEVLYQRPKTRNAHEKMRSIKSI